MKGKVEEGKEKFTEIMSILYHFYYYTALSVWAYNLNYFTFNFIFVKTNHNFHSLSETITRNKDELFLITLDTIANYIPSEKEEKTSWSFVLKQFRLGVFPI